MDKKSKALSPRVERRRKWYQEKRKLDKDKTRVTRGKYTEKLFAGYICLIYVAIQLCMLSFFYFFLTKCKRIIDSVQYISIGMVWEVVGSIPNHNIPKVVRWYQ